MTTSTEPRPAVAATRQRPATSRLHRGDAVRGWIYMAPFGIAFALFLLWPTVYGLWMSFTGQSLTGANTGFIGFVNYAEALADPQVWCSLWSSVWFTVLSTISLVFLLLLFALLV